MKGTAKLAKVRLQLVIAKDYAKNYAVGEDVRIRVTAIPTLEYMRLFIHENNDALTLAKWNALHEYRNMKW